MTGLKLSRLLFLFGSLLGFMLFPTSLLPCSENGPDVKIPWAGEFQRQSARYLPALDWEWLPAQAWQESAWKPRAISHAGARGLMQTMPRTHAEIGQQLGLNCSPYSAKCSILYGAYYDGRMARIWSGRGRSTNEIIPLMLGSYNCGPGCVINAQRMANDARDWIDIKPFLSRETREYPFKIRQKYFELTE